jgi:hypothetical protein
MANTTSFKNLTHIVAHQNSHLPRPAPEQRRSREKSGAFKTGFHGDVADS